MNNLTVYTGRVQDIVFIPDYFTPIDITVKSASTDIGRFFAPTWNMVLPYKRGDIGWDEYRMLYINLLCERTVQTSKQIFLDIFNNFSIITLLCYCPENSYCHRTIVIELLCKFYEKYNGQVQHKGFLRY